MTIERQSLSWQRGQAGRGNIATPNFSLSKQFFAGRFFFQKKIQNLGLEILIMCAGRGI